MHVQSFSEIENDFTERIQRMVWCNVATVDSHNRPRSRVLHPFWEGSVGWIATGRNTPKSNHLLHNSAVSLAYVADHIKPVYIDSTAEWIDDLDQKQRIWELLINTPPPVGYNVAAFFPGGFKHPDFGLLKLTPWRIELGHLGGEARVWSR